MKMTSEENYRIDLCFSLLDGAVIVSAVATGSSPISWASWNSLLRMKFRPNVAVTFVITDVVSFSIVWYLGSGKSPMNRKMVIQRARAAF